MKKSDINKPVPWLIVTPQKMNNTQIRLIDIAEKKAEAKFDAIMDDLNALNRESKFTFAFIATGLSAVFGYGLKILTNSGMQEWPILVGIVAVLVHLFILGWILITKCMIAKSLTHKGNEPSKILTKENKDYIEEQADGGLDRIREEQCNLLEKGIRANAKRNIATAAALNCVRRWILILPLTFLVSWGVSLGALWSLNYYASRAVSVHSLVCPVLRTVSPVAVVEVLFFQT